MSADPIDLLYGGLAKLGPGTDEDTRRVLDLVPGARDLPPDAVVVDAGCGTGHQTLVLARELPATVDALDTHAAFLETLRARAAASGLADRVRTHALDMATVPARFSRVDLLWSEGAIYNLGFEDGLRTWAACVPPGRAVVVSELTWMVDDPPVAAARFFADAYPAMQSLDRNIAAGARAGFACAATHVLPRDAWTDGYYDVLAERAKRLAAHDDATVRAFADETLREIEVFEASADAYAYVFYVFTREDRTPA